MSGNDFCGKTLFITLVNVCEKISVTSIHNKKVQIFKNFLSTYREQSKGYKDDNFYPILRLLVPQLEHERGPYGIKEHNLAKIYIRILCLSQQSKDAQKLMNFRVPRSSADIVGDFADVAYFILKPRCPEGGKLNVREVNQGLDDISANHAAHKSGAIDDRLKAMFLKMSALEQKWLIRMLLKDMKLGLSENKLLNLFHEDAKELYDVSNDLKKVCITLKDPCVRLHEIEISVFKPFRPMLSQRCDVQDVEKDLPKLEYYFVEIKYDGERFQLHCNNGEYKYFSRNGYDYTATYGSNASNGILTPYVAKQLSSDVVSCILDGEMMCWNTQLKSFTTKGKNIDVKSLRVGNVHQPCFCVFDILYYNGNVLTSKPLVDRLQILDKILESQEGVIVKGGREKVTNRAEIMKLLNRAIDDCEEGLVVKEPHSIYKPNARKAGWYKIKPEYTAGSMVELDLLIIGGYFGEKNKTFIRQFLVALADNGEQPGPDGESLVFKSFACIGSGYTKDRIGELNEKLRSFWRQTKYGKIPNYLQWSKEKPDVWIEPRNSCILEIIATESTYSKVFKVGHTLRFPRVKSVRYDKSWKDCMSVAEFDQIRQKAQGKLCVAHISTLNDVCADKTVTRTKKCAPTVNEKFKSTNLQNVKTISNFLDGLEICVLNGHPDMSKNDIEKKVIENGGKIVQNPGKGTYCVLANDERNIRVKNLIKSNSYDVVRIGWMMDCFSRGCLINRKPDDFISVSPTTSDQLSNQYDRYGDSYTEPVDLNSLEKLLNKLEKLHDEETEDATNENITKLEQKLFDVKPDPHEIFKDCFAYFDNKIETSAYDYDGQLSLHTTLFQTYGGKIHQCINEHTTTHIVVHSRTTRVETLNDLLNTYGKEKYFVVTEKWIENSFECKKRLAEASFTPSIEARVVMESKHRDKNDTNLSKYNEESSIFNILFAIEESYLLPEIKSPLDESIDDNDKNKLDKLLLEHNGKANDAKCLEREQLVAKIHDDSIWSMDTQLASPLSPENQETEEVFESGSNHLPVNNSDASNRHLDENKNNASEVESSLSDITESVARNEQLNIDFIDNTKGAQCADLQSKLPVENIFVEDQSLLANEMPESSQESVTSNKSIDIFKSILKFNKTNRYKNDNNNLTTNEEDNITATVTARRVEKRSGGSDDDEIKRNELHDHLFAPLLDVSPTKKKCLDKCDVDPDQFSSTIIDPMSHPARNLLDAEFSSSDDNLDNELENEKSTPHFLSEKPTNMENCKEPAKKDTAIDDATKEESEIHVGNKNSKIMKDAFSWLLK